VTTAEHSNTDSGLAARCAALASLGAASIHVVVAPAHWRDWLPSGVFFAALATFQVVWALVAWWRSGALLMAIGMAVNLGAAGLWVMSCSSGPPVGPSAGQPEAVGAAGICVLLLQCYVVMGAGWAWAQRYQPDEASGWGRVLVLVGANAVVAAAATVGLAASVHGGHHHHGGPAGAFVEQHAPSEAHPRNEAFPVTDMAGRGGPVTVPTPAPATPGSAPDADGHQHHHGD
jgi:hypothetical protein